MEGEDPRDLIGTKKIRGEKYVKFDLFNEQNKKNLKFFFIKKELPLCDYQIKILIYNKIIKSNNTVICKEIITYCSTVLMIIYIIHVFAVGEFVHWNLYRSLHFGRWRLCYFTFPNKNNTR